MFILVAFVSCVIVVVAAGSDENFCADIVQRARLDSSTGWLDLDDLIVAFHAGLNLPTSINEWDLNLTCFRGLNGIGNAGRVNLTAFAARADDLAVVRIEYKWKEATWRTLLRLPNASNIESLVLNRNPFLLEIPAGSFSMLVNLGRLDLAWNQICPAGRNLCLQAASFEGLTRLVHLDLSGNPLDLDFETGFFANCRQLLYLSFSSTCAAKSLKDGALSGLEHLETLKLAAPFKKLCPTFYLRRTLLNSARNIKTLDMSGLVLDKKGEDVFADLSELTELRLTDSEFLPTRSLPVEAFAAMGRLKSLDMSRRYEKKLENLVGTLQKSSLRGLVSLDRLNLSYRLLKTAAIHAVTFSETPALRQLDLSTNSFDADVIRRLLWLNATLDWLSLERNPLVLVRSDTGLGLLNNLSTLRLGGILRIDLNVSLFSGLARLQHLDLTFNKIANLTVRAFEGLNELMELNLTDNFIRTIENGTFTPLTKLARLNLQRNQLRNLFFFGLGANCAIFLDTLGSYNISLVDLGQMGGGREHSFLEKKLHLRNARVVSVYRNVRVDWRSAWPRPNCSLYFHLFRRAGPTTMNIDQAYLQDCSHEELDASTSATSIFQEHAVRQLGRPGLRFELVARTEALESAQTTTDGYLVGLGAGGREIVALKLVNGSLLRRSVSLASRASKLAVVSTDLFATVASGVTSFWKASDKANLTLILSTRESEDLWFALPSGLVASTSSLRKTISLWDLGTGLPRLKIPVDAWFESATVFGAGFLVTSHTGQDGLLKVWDLRSLEAAVQPPRIVQADHVDAIKFLASGSNGELISASLDGAINVWIPGDDGELKLKRALKDSRIGAFVVLKACQQGDVLLVSVTPDLSVVKAWSSRFGKQLEAFFVAKAPKTLLGSARDNLLYIDDSAYKLLCDD